MKAKNIFISYSTKSPDAEIASDFYDIFVRAGHRTFLAAKSIKIGERWSDAIASAITECEYFIVLLSENSAVSDMVTEEVKRAKELNDLSGKNRPLILPIRLNLSAKNKLNYDISGYLNRIQHKNWKSNKDTNSIADEILSLLNEDITIEKEVEMPEKPIEVVEPKNESLPLPNAPLEIPGGTISLNSKFYVERENEKYFISKVKQEGALLKIKGPRQFGKTSLMARLIQYAKDNDHLVVPLSLQQFNAKNLQDLNKFLIQICAHASRKIGVKNQINQFWDDEYMDVKMKCTTYFEEYLIPEAGKPILLAIDEADRIFEYKDVSSEFFGLLRFWHEEAKIYELWKQMKIAISHSTEAYLAITNMNQSPFNVGLTNKLKEFTIEQVATLAEKHKLNFSDKQLRQLTGLVGGHPYLIRKALYEIASENYSFDDFMKNASNEDGPFSDHLKRHYFNLTQSSTCFNVMKEIVTKESASDTIITGKLRAAGLVKGAAPSVKPSFKLYEDYFNNLMQPTHR